MKDSEQMLSVLRWMVVCLIALSFSIGCGKKTSSFNVETYKKEIKQWQEKRAERLANENGWLTLCGLYWLKSGENTFGTDSANTIIFPSGKSPKIAGSLWLENGVVKLRTRPHVEIKFHDSLVTSLILRSDEEGKADPTVLTTSTLSFYLIKRGSQLGVRIKDKGNPARTLFKGLDFFDVNLQWRIEAKFLPYNPTKVIQAATVVNTVQSDTCIGAVVFNIGQTACRLEAILERGTPDQLYIMFSDETSGKETYGNGRQLNTDMPDENNNVMIDFNKAYNWPCAYTEFATCPIPPRENHLNIRVEAGEKKYPGNSH
jgi:uncharacterized protein (DUF1684 family)